MSILNGKALKDWLKSRIVNNLLTTEKGFWLDARLGPVIQKDIDDLRELANGINSNLMEISDAEELVNKYVRCFYAKKGQSVELYIEQNKVEFSNNTQYTLGTLPIGYRPLRTFATMTALGRSTPIMAYLSVTSTGVVTIHPYGDLPIGGYTYCHVKFNCR